MLTLSGILILSFVIWSLIQPDIDDDDGPGGGLMQPVYTPNQ
jgi:hypothetical protein